MVTSCIFSGTNDEGDTYYEKSSKLPETNAPGNKRKLWNITGSKETIAADIYTEDMQILTRPQTQEGQQPAQNQQQYGANQYSAPVAQTFTQPTAPAPQPAQQPAAEPVAQPFIGAPTEMDDDLPF